MVVALMKMVGHSAVQTEQVAGIGVCGEAPEQLGNLLFLHGL